MELITGARREAQVVGSRTREQIATPDDYVVSREVMLTASRNYAFASQFLPADVRPHVEALYAFLRVGDDRVDVSYEGFDSPAAAIDDWEHQYRRAFASGRSDHPVLRAYLQTARKYSIPESVMDPYFRAMRQDLDINRFSTFTDLMRYIEGSALPVGRAMTYILGEQSGASFQAALHRADSLSIAMQLSNFWRDIGEDWARGRVYLPLEDMRAFGVSEADLAAHRVTPAFVGLLKFEISRTQSYYREAFEGVGMLASGRWAVMSGLLIYQAILTGLIKNNYDPFQKRARANDVIKLWLVVKAAWKSLRPGTPQGSRQLGMDAIADEELVLS
ncbi:MAG: phytoene/squalene synthase family protein [Anaerolineales bacterium]